MAAMDARDRLRRFVAVKHTLANCGVRKVKQSQVDEILWKKWGSMRQILAQRLPRVEDAAFSALFSFSEGLIEDASKQNTVKAYTRTITAMLDGLDELVKKVDQAANSIHRDYAIAAQQAQVVATSNAYDRRTASFRRYAKDQLAALHRWKGETRALPN